MLGEAGPSIEKFLTSGVSELKSKLGPILWQFPPFKKYDADDIATFLALLIKDIDGLKLRHALEVRHKTFLSKDFIAQARQANIGIVLADIPKYPLIADLTSDFVYLRLQDAKPEIETGYEAKVLDKWVVLARAWQRGEEPDEFPSVAPKGDKLQARDVYVHFINGAKERAHAAARAMISILAT